MILPFFLACTAEEPTAQASPPVPTAAPGYTLFNPLKSTSVYLVDLNGKLTHQWNTAYNTGQSVYLIDNGNLLKASRDPNPKGPFRGGGEGGIIQEIAPDSTVVWETTLSDSDRRQHHDIEPLPNGNVLVIAWEKKARSEALRAGLDPARLDGDAIWPDVIVEIEPQRPNGGKVVWEWHVWDHLIQDEFADKANYGVVADHPERVDLNAALSHVERAQMAEQTQQLQALGYMDAAAADIDGDWLHTNAIDYNPDLDQILLSVRTFSEIWVIDHSTTTEQARGSEGGRGGKGGDLLFRWGNPAAWGGVGERQLFTQHDAQWIPKGFPGAGNITVFNNGTGRQPAFSSVEEIVPPLNGVGYTSKPSTIAWSWRATPPEGFFADLLSGAHRLSNGNTLITHGPKGEVVEVTPDGQVVWRFTNPYQEEAGPSSQRGRPPRGKSKAGHAKGGGGPPQGSIFRATRIPPDHPGLKTLLAQ